MCIDLIPNKEFHALLYFACFHDASGSALLKHENSHMLSPEQLDQTDDP